MNSSDKIPLDEKPLLEAYNGVALPIHTLDPDVLARKERRRSLRKKIARKLHALIFLGAFYYLMTRYVAFPAASKFFGTFFEKKTSHSSMTEWPIPSDVNVVECHEWSENALHEEHSTFELPVSSKALFFLSRGWMTGGVVKVVASEEDSENVVVDVLTKYSHPDLLENARVCQITHAEGENGVGIFTPPWREHPRRRRRRRLGFEVTISIPKSADLRSLLDIESFETDMPLFYHIVEDLSEVVNFKSISLKTAHTPIVVGSISAIDGSFKTENNGIHGTFNTSSSLLLQTSNAPIKVHVGLLNSEEDDFTNLSISTSNAPVEARISLASTESYGGRFKVNSVNSIANLDIAFVDAPVNSTLILDAETTLAPATVKLHKTFEGEFLLETSLTRPTLSVKKDVEDPSGKNRKRIVDTSSVAGSQIKGSVSWSEEGKKNGDVFVKTSISRLVLYV